MQLIKSLLDIELPVIQAPMAGVQDEALAIAVSSAGGLGSMPCALLDTAQLEAAMKRFSSLQRPINLNFFCHQMDEPVQAEQERWRQALEPYYREFDIEPPVTSTAGARRPIDTETMEVLQAFRPKVVSFHFGLPTPALLERMKAWGATVLASATTVDEGLWLERCGADVVIAQGVEAGGHRGHFLSDDLSVQCTTAELVASLSKVFAVPIVAAGGIGNREDAKALLAAGATAVQAGTAYLLCPEARTGSVHRAALQQRGRPGAMTNLFSGRPARGLVNRAQAEDRGLDDFTPLWAGTKAGTFVGLGAAEVTTRLAGTGK